MPIKGHSTYSSVPNNQWLWEIMSFESIFFTWINESLSKGLPTGVVGFSFNLYETNTNFAIELVGTSKYNAADPDWACEEIFAPLQRQLDIPALYADDHWQPCLEKMKLLAVKFINSNEPSVFADFPVGYLLWSTFSIGLGVAAIVYFFVVQFYFFKSFGKHINDFGFYCTTGTIKVPYL